MIFISIAVLLYLENATKPQHLTLSVISHTLWDGQWTVLLLFVLCTLMFYVLWSIEVLDEFCQFCFFCLIQNYSLCTSGHNAKQWQNLVFVLHTSHATFLPNDTYAMLLDNVKKTCVDMLLFDSQARLCLAYRINLKYNLI